MATQQNTPWIVFSADNHSFACAMNDVIEIVRVTDLLPSTDSVPSVAGWVNVRGEMIPVIDLVEHIFKTNANYSHNEIIVLKTKSKTVACIAERILAVSQPGQESELGHCFANGADQFLKNITYLDNSTLTLIRQ